MEHPPYDNTGTNVIIFMSCLVGVFFGFVRHTPMEKVVLILFKFQHFLNGCEVRIVKLIEEPHLQ